MKFVYALIAALAARIIWVMFFAAPYLSQDDLDRLGRECARWISEEYADGRATTVGGHWTKRQRHVFEILASRSGGESQDIVLCVVDVEARQMMKPSMFDMHNWR